MKGKLILVVSVALTAGVTLILSESYRYYNNYRTVPLLDEIILVKTLKDSIGIEKDVVLSIGPYHVFRNFILGDNYESVDIAIELTNSAYLFYDADVYYMMFDYEFYKRLSGEERKYVITHELWHARRFDSSGIKIKELADKSGIIAAIEEEGRADVFALKEVSYQTIIQFLNTYCNDQNERRLRIKQINDVVKN